MEHPDTQEKTVVVDYHFRVVIKVPAKWKAADVELNRNATAWCADNAVAELSSLAERECGCMCRQFKADFIREATRHDEKYLGIAT